MCCCSLRCSKVYDDGSFQNLGYSQDVFDTPQPAPYRKFTRVPPFWILGCVLQQKPRIVWDEDGSQSDVPADYVQMCLSRARGGGLFLETPNLCILLFPPVPILYFDGFSNRFLFFGVMSLLPVAGFGLPASKYEGVVHTWAKSTMPRRRPDYLSI